MSKVISCINLKGGVGKTALAVNFAAYCGTIKRKKTLLIDLDPQTNASFSCIGVEKWEEISKTKGTIANIMGVRTTRVASENCDVKEVIVKNVFRNVDLIPSHLEMFTIDLDIAARVGRERVLEKALGEVKNNYDIIVCDCPPNLTIPTQNAIAMSDYFVVPVSPDYLSAIGIALLLTRVREFCSDLGRPELTCAGIVLSRVGRRSIFRSSSNITIRSQYPELVLDNELTERSAVAESAEKQKPIFEMQDNTAAREFKGACQEIFNSMGV